MPQRTWTDDQLRAAVASSKSWLRVSRALGLRGSGNTNAALKRHAARLGLDTSHLPGSIDRRPARTRRFTDEDLCVAVAESVTVAEVMRRLGYQPSGGMHRYIKVQIRRLDLDTSHFVGQGWARGKPNPNAFRPRPLAEWLVEGSSIGGSHLMRRLIAAGLKQARCERCGRTEWEGETIPLHLDHVNGVPNDNRFENLRVLCPNCHALTPTYCGRNRGRVA